MFSTCHPSCLSLVTCFQYVTPLVSPWWHVFNVSPFLSVLGDMFSICHPSCLSMVTCFQCVTLLVCPWWHIFNVSPFLSLHGNMFSMCHPSCLSMVTCFQCVILLVSPFPCIDSLSSSKCTCATSTCSLFRKYSVIHVFSLIVGKIAQSNCGIITEVQFRLWNYNVFYYVSYFKLGCRERGLKVNKPSTDRCPHYIYDKKDAQKDAGEELCYYGNKVEQFKTRPNAHLLEIVMHYNANII